MLNLEITESAYMQDPEQLIRVVSELQGEGFCIEMDDFGSGYSSLNTLKDVPVNILKLDMRFLSGNIGDVRGGSILSSVIRMAHWLRIPVLAEGVETKDQADYLKSLSCFYMQGYYFARPMPAEQYEEMLAVSAGGKTDRYSSINLDGVAAFWDASAQTTMLFNSYVGGAAIIEYSNGSAEIVRANDKFFVQLGTTREKYLEKQLNTFKRFDEKYRRIFNEMLQEAIRTGDETECEVQSLPLDEGGARFWTHNRIRLLARSDDCCIFYLATENITLRKELEEQLRVNSEALQLSLVHIGRIICRYDIKTHELILPEAYAAKHNVQTCIIDVHLNPNIVVDEDKKKFAEFYEAIHRGEHDGSVLLRISAQKKAYTWEQLDFVTLFDDDGCPISALITCEDVTDLKEREAENIRNSIIIEHTGIGVIDYDVITDSLQFQSNMNGEQLMQRCIGDYLEKSLFTEASVVHPDDKNSHYTFFKSLCGSKPDSGVYECRADIWGTGYKWCRIHYVSMGDESGKVYRIIGQVSNIQKEKDDEALIAKLNQGLDIGTAGYHFNATMVERIFTTLYGASSTESSIERIMAVLGEYYNLSRVYIFEDSDDHKYCSNTFEWCADGIMPEKDNLKRVSYQEDMGGEYHGLFDKNGIFYCPDISVLPKRTYEILAPQGIKSILQCSIMNDGVFMGFVGFDDCNQHREWTDEQTETLLIVTHIIGAFLVKFRKQEQADFSEDFKAALDNNASYIYIIEPDTHEVVYNNKAIRNLFNASYEGKVCYREFINRDKPCENCPINLLGSDGKAHNVEIRRADGMLLLSQASPLYWNGRELMLITCVDISERQLLREELTRKATLLQALYDTMPCGILQYSLSGKEKSDITFNHAAYEMLGFDDAESFESAVKSWTDTQNVHPDDLHIVLANLSRVAESGGRADYEHRFLFPDGSVTWVRVQLMRFELEDGSCMMQVVFNKLKW